MTRKDELRQNRGSSTWDIFGGAAEAEAATPGSYGRAPAGFHLPSGTALGPVRLLVADLGRSLAYYEQVLGLRVLQQTASGTVLGTRESTGLVELVERPGIRPSPGRGRTGLFHFAILLPDRPSLGRFARHLSELGVAVGASDHLVSEALYLRDPDNLGIEVYADRPRTAWRRVGRELMMATDPLDGEGLLAAAGDGRWEGVPPETVIGHVHLHVGDLGEGEAFFSEGLGFDRTVWSYPGALFFGAGGYHHHLGTNLWAGPRASRPPADEAQLLEWTIDLPSETDVELALSNLSGHGYVVGRDDTASGRTAVAPDPWGTVIRLRAKGCVPTTTSSGPLSPTTGRGVATASSGGRREPNGM